MAPLNPIHALSASLAILVGVMLFPAGARASQEFPGAIQEAANMPCVPSCALCHGVSPGTADTFNKKKIGATLFTISGVVLPHRTDQLKAAYAAYEMKPENAAAVAALKQGVDPETGDSLCGPSYGCGAHVAKKAPPADLAAPLWVVGAMLTAGLLRRRRGKRAV